MVSDTRQLALVTGASTGIGFELAAIAARNGYDLIVVADEERIEEAARRLRGLGTSVEPLRADLSTAEGVNLVCDAVATLGRPVDLLFANAGTGLGGRFLDADFADLRHVIETNVTGTLHLVHTIARKMRDRNEGRILITGSIAGFIPGSFQAVYNASKAFLNNFGHALEDELKETDVTVTILMPGATETEFFERAGMEDTSVGQAKKDDAAEVAETGFKAMMKGRGDVVSGFKNKVQSAVANVTPASVLAGQHHKMAEPKSDRKG